MTKHYCTVLVCPSQATHALVAVAAERVLQLPPVASVQTVLQKDQEPYSATEMDGQVQAMGCSQLEGKVLC